MLAKLIASDIRAKSIWLYDSTALGALVKTVFTDGTFAMALYRLMQACGRNIALKPFGMICGKINACCARCIIGRDAAFGPGFVLIHSDGVVINTAVRGGRNVRLEHRVTIGAEKGAAPTLGDDVFVGAGAVLIGGIKIGNRARIGANAVVNCDVPDDATAVGVPARIIKPDSRHAAV